jgi:IS30 family transposase
LAGNTQTAIASILGVHRSTICREFKRNVPKRGVETGFYVAAKANAKTKQRHRSKAKNIKLTQELKKQESAWMTDRRLTPELISAEWRKQGIQGVSHETLYLFIWAVSTPINGSTRSTSTCTGNSAMAAVNASVATIRTPVASFPTGCQLTNDPKSLPNGKGSVILKLT